MYNHENIAAIETIIELKRKHKCSMLDAIVLYCENLDIDLDEFGEKIKRDKQFFEMLKKDAIDYNQLRKTDGWIRKATLEDFFS